MHCWETEIRLLAAGVFEEGKQRHLGDWKGREANTSNVTHTATINLFSAIYPAVTHKPVALNHRQLTEANSDDKYACAKREATKGHSYTTGQLRDTIHWRNREGRSSSRCEAAQSHQTSSGISTDILWSPVVRDQCEVIEQSRSLSSSSPHWPVTASSTFSATPPFSLGALMK